MNCDEKFLNDLLHSKVEHAVVTFTKADGTERVLQCTLNPEYIPVSESKNTRKSSDEVMVVYDIEKDAWRSFRKDSVIKVEKSEELHR